MAIQCERRLLFLCVSSLLLSSLVSFANPVQSKSWFDQRLLKKNQAFAAHLHNLDDRDALIAIALLDDIYTLRDHVSDPALVDSTLARAVEETATDSTV